MQKTHLMPVSVLNVGSGLLIQMVEKKQVRRWHLWTCIEGNGHNARMVDAKEEIAWLESKGFKAKIHAPLPQHQNSGHTHIVVLCTQNEKLFLAGVI